MKLKSLIMFSAAALAFAACSNEDDVNSGIKGDATVTVNIQDAVTRALETPTTGANNAKYPVQINKLVITLNAGSGTQTTDNLAGSVTDGQDGLKNATYTFRGVRDPQSVSVSINDCSSLSGLKLADVVDTGLAEPLYATSSTFTPGSNANEYTVELTPDHRLARLQFSGIKHVDVKVEGEENANCSYETLTLAGVFLNGVQTTEGNAATKSVTAAQANGVWDEVKGWTDAPVWDEITDGSTFLTDQDGWPGATTAEPAQAQCYAYNIFPAGKNVTVNETAMPLPKFTVYFTNAAFKSGVVDMYNSTYRFATVAKYVVEGSAAGLEGVASDGTIETFKAGYIYNITGLEIDDNDLGPTPDGGKDANVIAKVQVLPWTLVNATVEWN